MGLGVGLDRIHLHPPLLLASIARQLDRRPVFAAVVPHDTPNVLYRSTRTTITRRHSYCKMCW